MKISGKIRIPAFYQYMTSSCIVVCLLVLIQGCKIPANSTTVENLRNYDFLFPVEWVGHYAGKLNIISADSTIQVEMELTISHPDALGMYPWTLRYGEDDIRFYGLEVIDATKGHYTIDEYNSIKLDAYLKGNHFISEFEVMGNRLTFHYERVPGGIEIRVYASPQSSAKVTGGEIIGQDTVPLVTSFPNLSFQQGYLRKIQK